MPERKYKGKRYSVVFPQAIGEKIEELAEKEGRSISQMIARLAELGLEKYDN